MSRARYITKHLFPSGAFVIPWDTEHSIYMHYRLLVVLLCVHAPRVRVWATFFAPLSSPQRRKPLIPTHVAPLGMRGNYFHTMS